MPQNGYEKESKKLRREFLKILITFNNSNKNRIEIITINALQHQVIPDFLDE